MIDDCGGQWDPGWEFSPFDAEAEPEDLAYMELLLSSATEDFRHDDCKEGVRLDPLRAYGVPVDGSIFSDGADKQSDGPQEPECGCCDMPLDEYDPSQNAGSGDSEEK